MTNFETTLPRKSTGNHLPDSEWDFNDSSVTAYGEGIAFGPSGQTLLNLIAANRQPGDAGLDLAGGRNAVALRNLLDSGIITRALATNLQDRRTLAVRVDMRVSHVQGDLATAKPWKKIDTWRRKHAPKGIGLVLHRPYGALQNLPTYIYAAGIEHVLDLLRPGGMFFTQVPDTLVRDHIDRKDFVHDLRRSPAIDKVVLGKRSADPSYYATIYKKPF